MNSRVKVVATYDNRVAAEAERDRRQSALDAQNDCDELDMHYRVTPWAYDMYRGTLQWDVEVVYTFPMLP